MSPKFSLPVFGACAVVFFAAAGTASSQPAAPSAADQQAMMQQAMDMLRFAMRIRTVPLDGFEIPQEQRHWEMHVEQHGDVWITNYSTEPHLSFRVQTIICDDKTLKVVGQDATILGADETAETFYKANTNFLSFDDTKQVLACALPHMLFSQSSTNDPAVKWTTSHSRAIRHMAHWMRYFNEDGDSKRAADFFSATLEIERRHLQELAAGSDHSEELGALQLFEKVLPRDVFLPASALSAGQKAQVRGYLEAALQSERKLGVFAPQDQNIRRDQELLLRYR